MIKADLQAWVDLESVSTPSSASCSKFCLSLTAALKRHMTTIFGATPSWIGRHTGYLGLVRTAQRRKGTDSVTSSFSNFPNWPYISVCGSRAPSASPDDTWGNGPKRWRQSRQNRNTKAGSGVTKRNKEKSIKRKQGEIGRERSLNYHRCTPFLLHPSVRYPGFATLLATELMGFLDSFPTSNSNGFRWKSGMRFVGSISPDSLFPCERETSFQGPHIVYLQRPLGGMQDEDATYKTWHAHLRCVDCRSIWR